LFSPSVGWGLSFIPTEAFFIPTEASRKVGQPITMWGTSILAAVLLASSQPSSNQEYSQLDAKFHLWCDSVGIETPLARLETTDRSVAGRGVFATKNIQQGDVVITIPESIVFHEYNAAEAFPKLASKLWKQKIRHRDLMEKEKEDGRRRQRWWHRVSIPRRRRARHQQLHYEFTDSSDLWQGTLTSFGLAAAACCGLQETNHHHPWSDWISQWKRSDPMQTLFEKQQGAVTWRDEEEVLACVEELSKMLPDVVSKTKLRVAVEMRLGRLEELKTIFDLKDDAGASKMFGLLTSRAIELGDGIVGILPAFDMINHSDEPNIGMEYRDGMFQLWALKEISDGEELFVSYKDRSTSSSSGWDEEEAVWMLVQWGIPMPPPRLVDAVPEAASCEENQPLGSETTLYQKPS
jgi:SET domain